MTIGYKLYCGDCLDVMRQIPDRAGISSVRMCAKAKKRGDMRALLCAGNAGHLTSRQKNNVSKNCTIDGSNPCNMQMDTLT